MKDKKKLLIIIGSIVLFLTLVVGGYFALLNDNDDSEQSLAPENNVEDKLVAPATNTEELLQELSVVEVTNVTEDEIVFSDNVNLNENEKVAIWIYSEPKFLGYFEVLLENGVKKIVGLKEAIASISVESGKHNIAITTASGKNIGYIDVHIEESGKLTGSIEQAETDETPDEKEEQKTTTKEITETVEINFETTKQNEINMLKGTAVVVKEGQKGQKTITYEVTYDSDNKEISRKKKSEKIIKEAVNKIEKVGISDFNINTDMLTETSFGPACSEDQLTIDGSGSKECNNTNTKYYGVKVNNTYYITSFKENDIEQLSSPLKVSGQETPMLVASYNGAKYYFYMSAGGGVYELLTQETCSKYGLSCGSW